MKTVCSGDVVGVPGLSSRSVFLALALFALAGLLPLAAQESPRGDTVTVSFTGQFVVTGPPDKSPLLELPAVRTNADFVHLEPPILSISAERIKQTIYRLLGLPSVRDWRGKIYLSLHPALWADENVTVVSRPIDQSWSYLVALPNPVASARYLRGLTGALLLEYANRQMSADGHCAEIPDWLIDGMALQVQQDELSGVVLSAPDRPMDSPFPAQTAARNRDLDPLAVARKVLRTHPALTFEQLCWPTEAQLLGNDDGVYHASAQLLVAELLKLEDGPAHLRQMLASLPQCQNWQTAFRHAFQDRFPRPRDLEKWWALQVVDFLSHEPGPAWTPGFSARRLNELLTVPVEMRVSSNSLPSHAAIPLQTVLRDFNRAEQTAIFQTHLRDLRIAQFRMAPQFIGLTDAYCHVLANYLGEPLDRGPRAVTVRHGVSAPLRLSAAEMVSQLNALDARRRTVEAAVQPTATRTF